MPVSFQTRTCGTSINFVCLFSSYIRAVASRVLRVGGSLAVADRSFDHQLPHFNIRLVQSQLPADFSDAHSRRFAEIRLVKVGRADHETESVFTVREQFA